MNKKENLLKYYYFCEMINGAVDISESNSKKKIIGSFGGIHVMPSVKIQQQILGGDGAKKHSKILVL